MSGRMPGVHLRTAFALQQRHREARLFQPVMDTTSYWIDSASLPRFPKAGRPLKVDVVVIGGGLMGIVAAYRTPTAA